ncbi:MAG: potassium channel family protein [Planctomycetota bacterium]
MALPGPTDSSRWLLSLAEVDSEPGPVFDWPVWVATALCMGLCVLMHYEVIRLLLLGLQRYRGAMRVLLPGVIFCLIFAHLTQIGVYAAGYWCLSMWFDGQVGGLQGETQGSFTDLLYFSAAVFTTVGFGDIIPTGTLRVLVATEALTGLVLITWSASFTFLIMQRYFGQLLHPEKKPPPTQDDP